MSAFLKSLCKIAIPVTLQSMLQSSFSIIDQVMIGQLGETGIAAVGLCGNFSLIFSVMLGAVSTVAGILIARLLGAGEKREACRSLDVSLLWSLLLSGLFLGAAVGFPRLILGLYTADTGIIDSGTLYFRLIGFSYVPMALSALLSAWMRCKEQAAIPFAASLVSVAVNTSLNYLLIFGKLGLPSMGIPGAALASLASQMVNFLLVLLGFVILEKKEGSSPLWSLLFEKLSHMDYVMMILPILASEFLWSLGQNVESAVYGHLGSQALAAYTLTCPVQGLMVGALSGLSAAAGVLIGKRLGQKEYDKAYEESKKIMLVGLLGAVVVSVALIALSGIYTSLYRVDGAVKQLGRTLLVVFALYAPVKVQNMILGGGILRSGGNTRLIMAIDILGTWLVGIPLCLLAAYVLCWGVVGVYALLTTEEIFRLLVSLAVFKKKNWMVSLS